MSDGILSQDDLDALTGALGLGSISTPTIQPDSFDPAKKLLRILCDQASSVVSTVLSRSVDFRLGGLKTASEYGRMPAELVSQGLLITCAIRKELNGRLDLVMEKKGVAILADLMLMGSGNVEYADDHRDAIQEIVSQVMGSSSTTLSNEVSLSVEISQNGAQALQADPIANYGCVAEVKLTVEGFEPMNVLWLLDSALLQSLLSSKLHEASVGSVGLDTSLSSLGLGSAASAVSSPQSSATAPSFEASAAPRGDSFASVFGSTGNKALDLLMDIELPITIELGRTQMSLKRILEIGPGAIVEMERFAGEPVDILINGKVVAKGEVVVVDENFGVRIVALVSPEERIKMLR